MLVIGVSEPSQTERASLVLFSIRRKIMLLHRLREIDRRYGSKSVSNTKDG